MEEQKKTPEFIARELYYQRSRDEHDAHAMLKDDAKIKAFLLRKRQELSKFDQIPLRNARYDRGNRQLVGRFGYCLEWRIRADSREPISDTNPQYPHGIAVLTKPEHSREACYRCQARAAIKTDSKGPLCEKCANFVSEPQRKTPVPNRNQPCHCGSGKKYKACHMPRPGVEAAKLIGGDKKQPIAIRGERRRLNGSVAELMGALIAAGPAIQIYER
jgi:hypothetical protein